MIIRVRFFFFFTLVLLNVACSSQSTNDQWTALNKAAELQIGYNLGYVDQVYSLNSDLEEISGITYIDSNKIACVQDEEGRIFIYDFTKREIVEKIKFAKSGDYEGITSVGEDFYIVRSDGDIFKYNTTFIETIQIKTPLTSSNDVEGICFDSETNSLLILCKGSPRINGNEVKGRSIYSFSLENNKLHSSPRYSISKKAIRASFDAFNKFDFMPSGIAIHPISKNIFVIASVGKLLVVLKPDGSVLSAALLNPKMFQQPEGITFAPNGDLFISNEGKKGKPNILRFNFKPVKINE